jgi:hypothetical protein
VNILFDQIKIDEILKDRAKQKLLTEFHIIFRGDLARQRANISSWLKTLLERHAQSFEFKDWFRVVEHKFSLDPLNARGSILSETGGRFNIGNIDQSQFPIFPALYIAKDMKTAFFEKFGIMENEIQGKLSAHERALTMKTSISAIRLHGNVTQVVDVENRKVLKKFVEMTKHFRVPKEAISLAKRLSIPPPFVSQNPKQLLMAIMDRNWRGFSMHIDYPSNSQHFGQIAHGAGLEGILYRSTKNGDRCLAIFPENFKNSDSYVELTDAAPTGQKVRRLDRNTWQDTI